MEFSERRIFKIVILGYREVGKTSILETFNWNGFPEKHIETTAINFAIKHTEEAGEKMQLYLWDTGDKGYERDIIDLYCKQATGFILVYDFTNEETFKELDSKIKYLKEIAQDRDPSFLIVGNKLDGKSREVSKEKAEKFAAENGADFIEVNEMASTGINEAFDIIVRKIEQNMSKKKEKEKSWLGWLSPL
ncbi:ras-related protein Rab-8B-like [Ruditapes philippinarum]|uniref:ras-related protein Rab-8B-like n=1 Tax=Ruditapes philippinarum TaxID=129788 RepID=UPI00295B02C5|nr:ras-related protein Rab-8B-like [Ruditapes philippinarum]